MEMNYASKGVGNAGLTTGIIGTSLGALAALSGVGGVGNLFGVRNATDPQSVPVSRYDLEKEQQIAELKSQLALRDANTYGDQKALELYRYIDGRLQEINATLAAQAVNNQATKDSFQLVTERLECAKSELGEAICREAAARKCGDNTIVNYVNATFYPKQVADVTTGTTTVAQTTYNPLPVDTCGC